MNQHLKMYIYYDNNDKQVKDYISGGIFSQNESLGISNLTDPWGRKTVQGIYSTNWLLTPPNNLISFFSKVEDYTIAFWIYYIDSSDVLTIGCDENNGISLIANNNKIYFYTRRTDDLGFPYNISIAPNKWNYIEFYGKFNKSSYIFKSSVNGKMCYNQYIENNWYDRTHFYMFNWLYYPNRYINRCKSPVYDFAVYDYIKNTSDFDISKHQAIIQDTHSLEIENNNIYGMTNN